MDANTLSFAAVFVAGILSFLSPCTVPLLPVYFAYLSREAVKVVPEGETLVPDQSAHPTSLPIDPGLLVRTLLFVLGLSTAFFLLGFGAGAIGSILSGSAFRIGMGIVVILMGLYQTGLVPLSFLSREVKAESHHATRGGYAGAFALGFTFSLGWTPCVGPVLATILGFASQQGSALQSALLLAVYALGLSLPFLAISLSAGFLLPRIRRLGPFLPALRIIGGVLIIAMGVLLLLDRMTWLVGLFTI